MRTIPTEFTTAEPARDHAPLGANPASRFAASPNPSWPKPLHRADTGSYVAKKVTDSNTLSLLVRATEHAVAAVERLIQQAAGNPETLRTTLDQYVDLVFGHEVAFLFPNLEPRERDLLVALMKIRNTIGVHLNGLPQCPTPDDRAARRRTTETVQSEFSRLRQTIEDSGLEQRLDHLQRRLLRDEFLSILLDKSSSTQLFFRPGGHLPPRDNWIPVSPEKPTDTHQAAQRILLLDIPRAEADGIACWLGTAGYDTLVGTAGLDGCRLAVQYRPDLILFGFVSVSTDSPCDSVLDSRTILQVLSHLLRGRSVPVIGLFNAADFEGHRQLSQAGASASLRRPLDPHRLQAAVKNALRNPSSAHPAPRPEPLPQAA
jgi:CheY-like chemotaxis protein